jgi:hypothetical protein
VSRTTADRDRVLPHRAAVACVIIIAALIAAHLATRGLEARALRGGGWPLALFHWFDLDREAGVGTWFSQMLYLLIAASAWVIARHERGLGRETAAGWRRAAVVFLLLSIDEVAELHEHIIVALTEYPAPIPGVDVLRAYWIIYAVVVVAGAAWMLRRLLVALPRQTVFGLVVGAGAVVIGAVGLEVLSVGLTPADRELAVRLVAAEEGLEMLGSAVILVTVLKHGQRIGVSTAIPLVRPAVLDRSGTKP